jgi:hypothetical protein
MSFGAMLAMTCAVGMAADVWDDKPFTQWSDEELEKVLTDSPWAGKAKITHARQGANLGSVPDWKIVVAVRSALPLKQALVRGEIGTAGTPSAEHQTLLTTVEPFYRVSISGIPRNFVPQLQAVADAAVLRPKGKAPIVATQGSAMLFDREGRPVSRLAPSGMQPQLVRVRQRGGGARGGGAVGGLGGEVADNSGVTATLVLGFPRDMPITAQDQEFDFTTVIGAYNVKRTFKLKDMLFMGELAL